MINQTINNPYEVSAGTIKAWSSATPDVGWLKCDGSAVSRTTYSRLFKAIGTTYGDGDGETTFNLPELSNLSVPLGTGGTYMGNTQTGSIPEIKGELATIVLNGSSISSLNGCFHGSSSVSNNGYSTGSNNTRALTVKIDAVNNSSAYKRTDDRVVPCGVYMTYNIKY